MIIGFIGLGKMGKNMVLNLISKNIKVIAYNRSQESTLELARKGAVPALSIRELISKIEDSKKIIWLMLPANAVDHIINELKIYLTKGDIIIDGGNSYYKDSMRRARDLKAIGVNFMDVGVCNGPEGALHGSCLTIGGDIKVYENLRLLFSSLSAKDSYLYTGFSGSGHYAKMVHNIIEYGMMQSIGEGFESLYHSGFNFSLKDMARLWSNSSLVKSKLIELTANCLEKNPNLENVQPYVGDTGEGRWAILNSMEKEIPVPASSIALMARFRSRENDFIAEKLIASLRHEFGSHEIKNEIENKKEKNIFEKINKKIHKIKINKKVKSNKKIKAKIRKKKR